MGSETLRLTAGLADEPWSGKVKTFPLDEVALKQKRRRQGRSVAKIA